MNNKVDTKNVPETVAIIMDGNGRWAKKRGLPRVMGHRRGVDSLKKITEVSGEIGVKNLILYAFSTENWKRPEKEVNYLMKLPVEFLGEELKEIHENNIKITTIGDVARLPRQTQDAINRAKDKTSNNTGLNVIFAINYGGRNEIIEATKNIALEFKEGKIDLEALNEQSFSTYLETAKIKDPDLLIRPGGETRVSNYLLWQIAYSELYFCETLWPDFGEKEYLKAIETYQKRNRRYGGIFGRKK
ncbi:isoprenyl transferase [Proteinivorax hydrogeniformans]|uniref:Isoprenyl transferase n=1 Tax=Proteinivorax hydrogeniformans TaxID=1826727 RepID=A0AAU8HXB9_9FIRM